MSRLVLPILFPPPLFCFLRPFLADLVVPVDCSPNAFAHLKNAQNGDAKKESERATEIRDETGNVVTIFFLEILQELRNDSKGSPPH